jgi:uncharacterized protein (TIGR02678 family)
VSRGELERQRAFTGLLLHPVLERRRHPELFGLVRNPRHRPVLTEWFAARLGYRLVVTASAARLFRLPMGAVVTAPRRYAPPSRRVLVLAILAAAAAEDAEDLTTTQELSDRVRAISRHEDAGLAPYESDRFAERLLFVKGLELLVGVGALRPVGHAGAEEREVWAHQQDSVGGAYQVERELLLRMVDPAALAAALAERTTEVADIASVARFGVMRRLIELPVCLWSDLTEAEHAYLTGQRLRVAAWCTEMTGWIVEQRAEGLALITADENDTDLPFPRLRALDFAALMLLDQLRVRHDADGVIGETDLVRAVTEVQTLHARALTKELAAPEALRERAMELLHALDLVRPVDGGWWLTPAAARFRDPSVVSVTSRLDEDGGA